MINHRHPPPNYLKATKSTHQLLTTNPDLLLRHQRIKGQLNVSDPIGKHESNIRLGTDRN